MATAPDRFGQTGTADRVGESAGDVVTETFVVPISIHCPRTHGSSALRSPSPAKLIESVVTRIANPGKRETHQARLNVSRPSESMMPHSGVGGCAHTAEPPLVATNGTGSAGASAAGIAVVPAGTRIHGGDKGKRTTIDLHTRNLNS